MSYKTIRIKERLKEFIRVGRQIVTGCGSSGLGVVAMDGGNRSAYESNEEWQWTTAE